MKNALVMVYELRNNTIILSCRRNDNLTTFTTRRTTDAIGLCGFRASSSPLMYTAHRPAPLMPYNWPYLYHEAPTITTFKPYPARLIYGDFGTSSISSNSWIPVCTRNWRAKYVLHSLLHSVNIRKVNIPRTITDKTVPWLIYAVGGILIVSQVLF